MLATFFSDVSSFINNATQSVNWSKRLSSLPHDSWTETEILPREQSAAIRVLVAEPDRASRRLICSILRSEPDMKLQCVDNSQLISSIQECAPDLVIMDIHASQTRRASNWEDLGIKSPAATILTTYDSSSVTSFSSASADLLIKPFNVEQLQLAVEVARSKILRARSELETYERSNNPDHSVGKRQFLQRVAAESGERIVLIRVPDILWLQSFGNHIRIHLKNATYLVRQTMKNFQTLLNPNYFLRVHRNAIVNLDHVDEFYLPPAGNMFVKLNNGTCLPLRRANRALLRKTLKSHFLA